MERLKHIRFFHAVLLVFLVSGVSSARVSKKEFDKVKKRVIASIKSGKLEKKKRAELKKIESYEVWTSPNRIDIYEISREILNNKPVYFIRFRRGQATLFYQTISEKKFKRLKRQAQAIYPLREDAHCEYPMSAHKRRGKKTKSRHFCFKKLSKKQKKHVHDFVKEMNMLLGIKS